MITYFAAPTLGVCGAMVLLRQDFPGLSLTRYDVRNLYRRFRHKELQLKIKTGLLREKLEVRGYFFE